MSLSVDGMLQKIEDSLRNRSSAEVRKDIIKDKRHSIYHSRKDAIHSYRRVRMLFRKMKYFYLFKKAPIYLTNFHCFKSPTGKYATDMEVYVKLPTFSFRKGFYMDFYFLFRIEGKDYFEYIWDDMSGYGIQIQKYTLDEIVKTIRDKMFEMFLQPETDTTMKSGEDMLVHCKKWFDMFYPELTNRIEYEE